MTQLQFPLDIETFIQNRFSEVGIEIQSIERKDYPGESIFVVYTAEDDFYRAMEIGNALDHELAAQEVDGFVAVRKTEREVKAMTRLKVGVKDSKATELVNLLTARARTSEVQPSLSYVSDTAENILTAITPRHHLIFGRRGTGKTALMVEAKQRVESEGCLSYWINIHTHRGGSANRIFVWVCRDVCEHITKFFIQTSRELLNWSSLDFKITR